MMKFKNSLERNVTRDPLFLVRARRVMVGILIQPNISQRPDLSQARAESSFARAG